MSTIIQKYQTASDINEACSVAYNEALRQAKRGIGKGCYRSRGRWVRGLDAKGNTIYGECDSSPWTGKASDLKALHAILSNSDIVSVVIEGGIDFAGSVRDFADGAYDPYVADWTIEVLVSQP